MPYLLLAAFSSTAHAEDSGPKSGLEGGFPFSVGGATFEPDALAQLWLTAYDMDSNAQADASGYGDPEDDPGLKVKRFRLGMGGGFKRWSWRLTVGTSAPYDGLAQKHEPIELVDAWLGVEPVKGLDIKMGQGKLPFSRDKLMGAGELTFTERGIATEHLVPDEALGLTVGFARAGGKFTVGAFNAGGDIFGDVAPGKTIVGRLEWAAGKANTYQTWGDRKEFGFGVGANAYYTIGEATDTWAAGGDAMLRVRGFSLLVDGAYSVVSPTATTVDTPEVWTETTRWGVTSQLGYQVGAFEPAIRFSMFDDSTIGSYSQMLAGVAWHTAEDHVRIGAGYELRLEGQDSIDNDTARLWAQFKL